MKSISCSAGLIFSLMLVIVLALPAIQWATQASPCSQLYGYTDDIPDRPSNLTRSFFDKSLQHWIEKYFSANMGFRTYLIRSFNEINFLLFHEAHRLHLISTREHGLYSIMSIDSLNGEIRNKTTLEETYRHEANKLLQVQQCLSSLSQLQNYPK